MAQQHRLKSLSMTSGLKVLPDELNFSDGSSLETLKTYKNHERYVNINDTFR